MDMMDDIGSFINVRGAEWYFTHEIGDSRIPERLLRGINEEMSFNDALAVIDCNMEAQDYVTGADIKIIDGAGNSYIHIGYWLQVDTR